MTIHPVIMCGGAGTRLWPVSNLARPKQLHALVSDKSVFRETVLRVGGAEGFHQNPVIISNAAYGDLIAHQLFDNTDQLRVHFKSGAARKGARPARAWPRTGTAAHCGATARTPSGMPGRSDRPGILDQNRRALRVTPTYRSASRGMCRRWPADVFRRT